MIKVVPTSEQVKTVVKYGLRFEDVVIGKEDGTVTVKDQWRMGMNARWYIIDREGTFRIEYKNPLEG